MSVRSMPLTETSETLIQLHTINTRFFRQELADNAHIPFRRGGHAHLNSALRSVWSGLTVSEGKKSWGNFMQRRFSRSLNGGVELMKVLEVRKSAAFRTR